MYLDLSPTAAVSSDGSIFVLDGQKQVVQVYAADGQHIRSLGRPGRGPGEFRDAAFVALGADGEVVVAEAESGVVHIFSPSGELLSSWQAGVEIDWPLQVADNSVYVRPKGRRSERSRWWGDLGSIDGSINSVEVVRAGAADRGVLQFDFDGELRRTFPPPPMPGESGPYHEDPNGRIYYGIDFSAQPWWRFFPPAIYYVGSTDTRAVLSYSASPGPQGIAIRDTLVLPPSQVRLTDGERRMVQQQLNTAAGNCSECEAHGDFFAPTFKPAYHRFFVAQSGELWVMRHASSTALEAGQGSEGSGGWAESHTRFDVFADDGTHLGSVYGPPGLLPLSINGDLMLARTKHATGVDTVTVLRLTWPPRPEPI